MSRLPVGSQQEPIKQSRRKLSWWTYFWVPLVSILVVVLVGGATWRIQLQKEQSRQYRERFGAATVSRYEWEINHSLQHVLVLHSSPDRPYLLFVHGGPGFPFPGVGAPDGFDFLLQSFNLVFWDQRMAGLSYDRAYLEEPVTTAVLAQDVVTLLDRLNSQFHVTKVHVLAHSWGSLSAVKALQMNEDNFASLVLVNPVLDFEQSNKESLRSVKAYAEQLGLKSALSDLDSLDETKGVTQYDELMMYAKWVNGFEFQFSPKSDISASDLITPFWRSPFLSLGRYLNVLRGQKLGGITVLNDVEQGHAKISDFGEGHPPVYVLLGEEDRYMPSLSLMSQYGVPYDVVPQSGHWLFLENKTQFERLIRAFYRKVL